MEEESDKMLMQWPDVLVVVLYFVFVLAVGLFVSIPGNFFHLFGCVSL